MDVSLILDCLAKHCKVQALAWCASSVSKATALHQGTPSQPATRFSAARARASYLAKGTLRLVLKSDNRLHRITGCELRTTSNLIPHSTDEVTRLIIAQEWRNECLHLGCRRSIAEESPAGGRPPVGELLGGASPAGGALRTAVQARPRDAGVQQLPHRLHHCGCRTCLRRNTHGSV